MNWTIWWGRRFADRIWKTIKERQLSPGIRPNPYEPPAGTAENGSRAKKKIKRKNWVRKNSPLGHRKIILYCSFGLRNRVSNYLRQLHIREQCQLSWNFQHLKNPNVLNGQRYKIPVCIHTMAHVFKIPCGEGQRHPEGKATEKSVSESKPPNFSCILHGSSQKHIHHRNHFANLIWSQKNTIDNWEAIERTQHLNGSWRVLWFWQPYWKQGAIPKTVKR